MPRSSDDRVPRHVAVARRGAASAVTRQALRAALAGVVTLVAAAPGIGSAAPGVVDAGRAAAPTGSASAASTRRGTASVATAPRGPLYEADPPGTFELPVIRDAAEFTVRDAASGDLLRLSDLRGRAVVLSLFYTTCADGNACPLATATLRGVQRAIADKRLEGRVVLLSVTFDEAHDTAAILRAHRDRVGAGPSWIFATPETAERRAVLLEAFDQRIARAPDGTIVHPLRVYLIDGRGRVRQIYSQSYLRADVLVSDVETVLAD